MRGAVRGVSITSAIGVALLLVLLAVVGATARTDPRTAPISPAGMPPSLTSDLYVSISVSPTFPEEGKQLTLTANVFGNSTGPFTYSWSGLPTGCGSSNTAELVCTPSDVGQFQVTVAVTTPQGDFGAGTATVPVTLNPTNVVSGVLWFFALVVILAVAGSAVFLYFIYRVITDADRSNRRWTPPPPNWPNYGPPSPMPPPPPSTFPPPPPPSPPLR